MATAYHAVGLRVKSVLDSGDYGDADEPMISEGHSSCPASSLTGGSATKVMVLSEAIFMLQHSFRYPN